MAGTWRRLHNPAFFQVGPHATIGLLYPLLPWFGVMAVGYGFGGTLLRSSRHRKIWLSVAGIGSIVLFIVLRAFNVYGDPSPWIAQSTRVFTALSFVNCTKYPPSLLYILMTLGPAFIGLSLADGLPQLVRKRLAIFGRVPLFYYLLHLPLLHGTAVLLSLLRYGQARWLLHDSFANRGAVFPLPAGYGYDLWVINAIWIVAVLALYPCCKWYEEVKRTSNNSLLSYL